VNWIDKSPITGTIVYRPPSWTNTNVEAEISFNKPLGDVTIHNNSGNAVYEYTGNGVFEYLFQDKYGNTGSLETEVTWIDREPPVCRVKDRPINGNSTNMVTLTDCNEPITILNNSGSNEYLFTGNGTFTFEYEDRAKNRSTTEVIMTEIRKP
jgi:hypothetical protein